jgi:hypothetical protein
VAGCTPCPRTISTSRWRPTYDESNAAMFDDAVVEPAVAFLAVLAGDGPALDMGIGTGRIALVSNFGGFQRTIPNGGHKGGQTHS